MGQLGPKRGQSEDLGYFLVQNALIFTEFLIMIESSDIYYLMVVKVLQNFAGPKSGKIRAEKGPKWSFRQFSCSKCFSFYRF